MANSANPFTAALDFQRESLEAMTEAVDRSRVAPERIEQMQSVDVGETPSDVVYTENKLELLHYDAEAAGIDVPEEEREDIPILIIYALINRPYILDLQPERSVVRRLLEAGHDVYLIDWNEPSRLDQHLTLDDYINRYIDNCVDEVAERSGQDAINILGYCMGGTMSAIYSALHPEKVNALGLMAAGLCFDRTGGVLEEWGSSEYYEPQDVVDTFGNVPSDMLDVGFALMDPVDNYVSKYIRLAENIENEDFVENFGRMEQWLEDGVDVAGAAYVEFLEKIYQNNDLYNNRLEIDGKRVDIRNIDMPVLQLMGEYDHLIPPAASKPFNDVIGSDDVTTMEYSTGHIGLSVSSSTHEGLWPDVCDWYKERNREAERREASESASGEAASSEEAEAETETHDPATGGQADVSGGERSQEELEERATDDVSEEPAPPGEMEVDEEVVDEIVDEESDTDEELADEADEDLAGEADETAEQTSVESTGDDEGVEIDAESPAETAEEAVEDAVDEAASAEDMVDVTQEADVDTLNGVGPTYADRLHEAGIQTVADLAEYDVSELAEIAETTESRVRDWLDQL